MSVNPADDMSTDLPDLSGLTLGEVLALDEDSVLAETLQRVLTEEPETVAGFQSAI